MNITDERRRELTNALTVLLSNIRVQPPLGAQEADTNLLRGVIQSNSRQEAGHQVGKAGG